MGTELRRLTLGNSPAIGWQTIKANGLCLVRTADMWWGDGGGLQLQRGRIENLTSLSPSSENCVPNVTLETGLGSISQKILTFLNFFWLKWVKKLNFF